MAQTRRLGVCWTRPPRNPGTRGPHLRRRLGAARAVERTFPHEYETGRTGTGSRRHPVTPAAISPLCADALEPILQKLKLLEFGLFGLQQYGRNASLDVEDIGPFYRLAEEIGGDVLALQRRLDSNPTADATA